MKALKKGGDTDDNIKLHPLTSTLRDSLVTNFTEGTENPKTGDNTYCNLGLEKAYDILNAAKSDGRNKITVFFTDGEPGSNANRFAEVTARSSIEWSNKLKSTDLTNTIDGKEYKSIVYAVGLMTSGTATYHNTGTGSGTGNPVSNDKYRFMHYTSSNYDISTYKYLSTYKFNTDLTDYKCQGKLDDGTDCTGHGSEAPHGYFVQSDGSNLLDIFDKIARESSTGGSTIKLDAQSTTVVDVISSDFVIPEGTKLKDLGLYVDTVTGYSEENGYIFGNRTNLVPTGARLEDYVSWKDITSEGNGTKSISVTKFDFTADDGKKDGVVEWYNGKVKKPGNWVGPRVNDDDTDYCGKRLVITIPIVESPDSAGGFGLPTNTGESGIYTKEDGKDKAVDYFPIPHLDFPAILIVKKGLKKGESAMFKVERGIGEGKGFAAYAQTDPNYLVYNVALTGDDDATDDWDYLIIKDLKPRLVSGTVGKDAVYDSFKVTETGWSWTYKAATATTQCRHLDQDDSQEFSTKYGIPAADSKVKMIVFEFVNTDIESVPDHAESIVTNDFSKAGTGAVKTVNSKTQPDASN